MYAHFVFPFYNRYPSRYTSFTRFYSNFFQQNKIIKNSRIFALASFLFSKSGNSSLDLHGTNQPCNSKDTCILKINCSNRSYRLHGDCTYFALSRSRQNLTRRKGRSGWNAVNPNFYVSRAWNF